MDIISHLRQGISWQYNDNDDLFKSSLDLVAGNSETILTGLKLLDLTRALLILGNSVFSVQQG